MNNPVRVTRIPRLPPGSVRCGIHGGLTGASPRSPAVLERKVAASPHGEVVTGNVFDKYGSANPVVRWIMAGFRARLLRLFHVARASSVLDVGTGEGVLARSLAGDNPDVDFHGIDLNDSELRAHWKRRELDNLRFSVNSAYQLSFASDSFALVTCVEVLEHLEHPGRAVREMIRVSRGWLIASVPREPLWRILNVARGAYLSDFGNTPGHVNHWSKCQFLHFMGRFGEVHRVECPVPWTMVLVRAGD